MCQLPLQCSRSSNTWQWPTADGQTSVLRGLQSAKAERKAIALEKELARLQQGQVGA
jgi:hypothetical protein